MSNSVPRSEAGNIDIVAGQNQGESRYTPLHVICAHRELPDKSHEEVLKTHIRTHKRLQTKT